MENNPEYGVITSRGWVMNGPSILTWPTLELARQNCPKTGCVAPITRGGFYVDHDELRRRADRGES